MKRLILTLGLVALVGCAIFQSRTSYNSLATVGNAVNSAYPAYLDLVVQHQVATNSVPAVTRAYNDFQAGYALAVNAAQTNLTNATPTSVLVLYTNVMNLILTAEGKPTL